MSVPLIIDPTSPLITAPEAVILDASWLYEPPPTRNAYREFLAGPRLPNARFWDLDAVSEPHPDGYALMLPSPERFAAFAGKHGITKDSHVIVYDGEGIFAAPRTAWTFKVYGHENVSVINGGLPRAKKEGVKLETGPPAEFQDCRLTGGVGFDEVAELARRPTPSARDTLLIDARPLPSYEGGHIPTSLPLDFPSSLLQDPAGFTYLRSPEDLSEYVGEKLGRDTLDQVVSRKASVVNSKLHPGFPF
ncbi:thiosulfate/3-mercaptopyruvate sulfurtransferase [Geosmithia morbida]|uniref:Thiosulfate/3-mercaptopyruvate sulfurtransferase n=1 Tax=Geosmithia morbida TaxID=1094350 RepID=A0A9P4Z2K6_9HYPO|nr:thiosulfate/3-mercaptopyruvate sulfurtransferase [Geosmithia morbida]KAF4126550.1 thiosulfate/3-mercaptopyruvate sulfurtransferase [Geosmithia morbida]